MQATAGLEAVGTVLLGTVTISLLLLQGLFPLRRQQHVPWRRMVRNLVLSAPSQAVMRLALLPVTLSVANWAQENRYGLLNLIAMPDWARLIFTFLLMDYAYWWWHRANHTVPLFWRFHNVHHTDLDLDVSTAARFHFGEMLLSVGFLSLAVSAFGIAPGMLIAFCVSLEAITLFHHSNWRLPLWFERHLNRAIVTPRMHGIHHSVVRGETDSNWGTVFCWWDLFHRTLRRDIPQSEITIGVPAYRTESELTVTHLWLLPFRKQRPWRLSSGEEPHRTSHRTEGVTYRVGHGTSFGPDELPAIGATADDRFRGRQSRKRSFTFWQQAPLTKSDTPWLSDTMMKRLLGAVALVTLVMTLPQIYTIWVDQQVAGISLWSWITYWVGSMVWLVYGIQKRDRIIYLPCAAWLLLDSAVVLGVLIYR